MHGVKRDNIRWGQFGYRKVFDGMAIWILARACAIAASSERAISTRGNRSSNEAGGSRPMLLKRMATGGEREETRGDE